MELKYLESMSLIKGEGWDKGPNHWMGEDRWVRQVLTWGNECHSPKERPEWPTGRSLQRVFMLYL